MDEPAHVTQIRTAYDAVADDYARLLEPELARNLWDRAVLGVFAERVRAAGGGRVADLGCGPGRITAHLQSLGVDAFGIDLSPAMVAVARRSHPGLSFTEGTMAAVDLPDGALAGIVAWYSIIHTPPTRLPSVVAEFARLLRTGGRLLVAFQAGDERVHLEQGYGHSISLDAYRLDPDHVTTLLADAGLEVDARVVRAAETREKTAQAYLQASKRM